MAQYQHHMYKVIYGFLSNVFDIAEHIELALWEDGLCKWVVHVNEIMSAEANVQLAAALEAACAENHRSCGSCKVRSMVVFIAASGEQNSSPSALLPAMC